MREVENSYTEVYNKHATLRAWRVDNDDAQDFSLASAEEEGHNNGRIKCVKRDK